MNKIKLLFALFLMMALPQECFAALAQGTYWQIQDTATTGNVNGAGFNTANANFPTDLAATSATTSAPVVTSATHTFVAGDVGAWVYVKSGTNWTPGWYKITSVATGAATLDATIGHAVLSIGPTGVATYNTSAGVATVSSPTAGTYGVDYSMLDTAPLSGTDGTQTAAGTTYTASGETFTPVMVGNIAHITACTGTGCSVGWYEIVSYTDAHNVVLDRTATNGSNAITASTFNVGGAGRLNGLENTFQAGLPAASIVWIKNGSYTLSGGTATANTNSTAILQGFFIGYNSIRGDTCIGTNRPVINTGSNTWTIPAGTSLKNLNISGSPTIGAVLVMAASSSNVSNVKVFQTSSSSGKIAINLNSFDILVKDSEAVSLNGIAISNNSGAWIAGSYIHDSATGLNFTNANNTIIGNIFEANGTAISLSVAVPMSDIIYSNTIYGSEAKFGTGINISTANGNPNLIETNIFYGLTTGITVNTGSAGRNNGGYNDYYNNTTDVTNWNKSASDLALNPQFVGASQLVGSTATTSGSVLTDSSASFGSVNDNVDVLHVLSGTGVTVANYLITSHTATTLTVNNALGTSSGGDVVYFVTHGHNFQIGTNLKGLGFPTFTNATGGQTTSYPDNGAVQRQEPSGSGGVVGFAAP